MPSNARSSTASHFAKNFGKATVGAAELEFFGIKLDNEIADAPTWQIAMLAVFLFVLLLKPRFGRQDIAVAFWLGAMGLSLWFLAEVSWIPMLTTLVYTRTVYPYLVVIPHCISANASYRAVHGDNADRVRALIFGFFLYGFGGSIVSDVLLGLPATALAHPRIIPCHFLGWALIWLSPLDWVYSTYSRSDSFFHYFIVAFEAVDAVTTPIGRIARGGRELQNKVTAPIMGGLFAGIGGATIRFLTGEGETTFATLQAGFYKTMGYSVLFWALVVYRCDNLLDPESEAYSVNHCAAYSGSDQLRVIIVSAHVVWTLLCDAGFATGHPFVWICEKVFHGSIGSTLISTFRLGPQARISASVQVEHKKED